MEEKKSFLATGLLCYFLGFLGIHRFYTKHVGIGVAQLLTLGGCGLWTFVDLIMICTNNFKDGEGKELEGYTPVFGWVVLGVFVVGILFQGLAMMAAIGGAH